MLKETNFISVAIVQGKYAAMVADSPADCRSFYRREGEFNEAEGRQTPLHCESTGVIFGQDEAYEINRTGKNKKCSGK